MSNLYRGCFLPSFSSFGQAVSEEKIKMWKVNKHVTLYQHYLISKGDNGKSYLSFNREDFLEINQSETRIACGCHVC
jgi:hypothetical protein